MKGVLKLFAILIIGGVLLWLAWPRINSFFGISIQASSKPNISFEEQIMPQITPTIRFDPQVLVLQVQNRADLITFTKTYSQLGNISLGNDQTLAGKLLCQSLTMQVVGQVSAGIKFSKIMPEDVMVNGYLVQIRIPSAEIFSGPVLDSQATQVLDTETCFLTDVLGKEDPELETRLRTQAELQILSWAQQDPTLFAEANAGAIAAMTQIARSIVPANYQVIVTTKP